MRQLTEEFFSRLGEALSSSLSAITSRKIIFEKPGILPLERSELFKKITTQGAIFAAPVTAPFHSLLIQFLPEDIGKFLPELGINPDAGAAPPDFTELHRSALQEMLGNAWGAAAPALTASLGLPFKMGASEVSWSSFPSFLKGFQAIGEVENFTAALFRLSIAGGPSGMSAVVMPADFFEKVYRKVHKPPPPSPVKKEAKMEALQVERVKKQASKPAPGGVSAALKAAQAQNLNTVLDIPVEVVVELGDGRMEVERILDLSQGSVIELTRKTSELLELKVNGIAVALGEVVAIDDHFGLRIKQMITPRERMEKQ